ncbi:MAG: sigma-70 family RNA polymerase sigma factor [Gemmatimonadota bacterium]|nr:sigma-70 family RNA polymerase sigma factor [Gemmatimonadota bacterium]
MTRDDDSHPTRDAEFAQIALPLLPVVVRVARSLTHDTADADDLVQETFLKAFRHWGTFDKTADCRRWLSAICRNTFFAQRSRQRWLTAVGDDHELETFAAVSLHKLAREKGVEDMFARLDLAPAIRRAIASLDPLYRDVVQLVDVQELRYEEAADVLGVPIGTVRSRLYRARRLLQADLVEYATDAGFASAPPSVPSPIGSAINAES